MKKQKDTSTVRLPLRPILRSAQDRAQSFGSPQASLSASSSLRSGHGSGLKTKKSPSTVRQFDKTNGKPPLRPILRSAQDRSQSFGSPQAPLGVTSKERKNTSASLSVTILQKLSILEDLLKKKDDKPLTFKEGCAYLGYAPSYLYKLTYRKVIPYYKPTGKIIFFSKCELDEWVYKSGKRETGDTSTSLSADLKGETEGGSTVRQDSLQAQLTTKDPNQIEMGFDEKPKSVKREKEDGETEILIEFPLKSRRRK